MANIIMRSEKRMCTNDCPVCRTLFQYTLSETFLKNLNYLGGELLLDAIACPFCGYECLHRKEHEHADE